MWYTNKYAKVGGQGLIRFADESANEETQFTHFEPYDAHTVFPCFDQPDIKATWIVSTITPPEWFVFSNEEVQTQMETVDSAPLELSQCFPQTKLESPAVVRVFKQSPLISTYLFAVAAGPFKIYADHYGNLPLRIAVRNSNASIMDPMAASLFDITKKGIRYFEDFFGVKYAFDKYDQVFVPGMLFGGMENVTCVILSELLFRIEAGASSSFTYNSLVITVLHELCHHWFGDLVTLRWWDDLWLNEGFATFMSYYSLERDPAFEANKLASLQFYMQKYIAYGTDERGAGHPIIMKMQKTGDTKELFDNITYHKGAAVLWQLLNYVGEEAFRKGLHVYLEKCRFGNAELKDLLDCIEAAAKGGIDIEYWAQEWLHTCGVNVLMPIITIEDGIVTQLIIQQSSLGTPEEYYRNHRIDIAFVYRTTGATEIIKDVAVEPTECTVVESVVGKEAPSGILLNYGDKTYALVQLDAASIQFFKYYVHFMNDLYGRYLLAYYCSWMNSKGLMSSADYSVFHPYLGLQ